MGSVPCVPLRTGKGKGSWTGALVPSRSGSQLEGGSPSLFVYLLCGVISVGYQEENET